MATLQKIRTRAGLLVAIVIGLALFAFILGDLLQSGSSLFKRGQLEIGVIDGETVQYPEFQKKVEELGEIYKSNTGQTQLNEESWVQVREQTWQTLLRDKLMGQIYENIGLAISPDELFDLLQGDNPHPIVQQIFTNQETGQFDRANVVNFLKNLEAGVTPEQKSYWLYLEKQIVNESLMSKYNTLVSKGLYVTREEAQQSLEARNKQVNVEIVGLRNIVIPDSTVKVSESELKAYYEAHKDEYKSENTRTIEYIAYTIVPSESDYKNAEKWINDSKVDFMNAPDNVQFVNSNSDVSFNDTWYKESNVPAALSTWIAEGAVVNDMFGPYFEGESYKLAKLHAVEMLPDSVQARHILLSVASAGDVPRVQALADSLKKVIEGGSDFGVLARLYSTDQGSALNGGDLGWFGRGMMVKPFENAAFNNKPNEVTIVPTQFGIHIVQTTKLSALSKQIQVAILERTVTPSTQTEQATYAKASKFASENQSQKEFDAAVTNEKLVKKMAVLRESDRELAGLEYPRLLIRAAFSGEKGSILKNTDGSPIFEMGNNFVIATLTGETEEGISSFASVKDRVELAVQKEKKSKLLAERIKNAASGKSDMYAIASALGTQVSIASAINFNTVSIPEFGMEPAVVGTAVSIQPNIISAPIEGNNGVYVLKVTSVEELGDTNVDSEKQRLAQSLGYRASMQTFDVAQKAVKIVDKRAKFY